MEQTNRILLLGGNGKLGKEIIPGNMTSKDIKNSFYGNLYGVKTKR